MKFYQEEKDAVLAHLETNEGGLTSAEAYRAEMQKAQARKEAMDAEAIREAAIKKAKSRWTPILIFSFVALLASLIIEPGLLISTAVGIIGLIVMLTAKQKAPIIIMGVLNMIFGGGIVSFVAGILMMFIPEDTLL